MVALKTVYSKSELIVDTRNNQTEVELQVQPRLPTEVDSNHSSLVYRRALKFGMSKQFLKPYGDFLGTRKWKWVDDLTLTMSNNQRCFFTHGRSADILKVSTWK